MTWRAPLYFLLGCFLGGYAAWANAGYALVNPPAGLSFNPNTGYNWKPDISTPPANGSWRADGFIRYAGKNISVPASWGPAANAATFAKNALRFNPWVFVGTTAMAIAVDAGFEFVDDEWRVSVEPTPGEQWGDWSGHPYYPATSAQSGACFCGPPAPAIYGNGPGQCNGPSAFNGNGGVIGCSVCPQTAYRVNLPCDNLTPPEQYRSPTEDDWNSFPVGPLTDTQLDEFSRLAPGGLPVTTPELQPVVAPLGNPYTDPVTGEHWRDMIRITPDPTPSSPLRVRLDPYREPLTTPDPTPENPNPTPQPDPTRPNETLPEMWPLFCEWAGPVCEFIDWFREPFVEPEPVDVPALELDEPSFGSVGLPSTAGCPAPRVVSLGVGTFQLSYDPFCQLADMIRPLVLVTSYLFAAFILLGVRRG